MSKIYLISPPDIIDLELFITELDELLSSKLVAVFQLRIKNKDSNFIEVAAIKCLKICEKHNILFILNDNADLAVKIGANGVHVGIKDGNIANIRNKYGDNLIIGASCYDSRDLAMKAAIDGANYVSFGAFFASKTKISIGNPDLDILNWSSEVLNIANVAIGGINNENCKIIANNKADFIAVISYIWSAENKREKLQQLYDNI